MGSYMEHCAPYGLVFRPYLVGFPSIVHSKKVQENSYSRPRAVLPRIDTQQVSIHKYKCTLQTTTTTTHKQQGLPHSVSLTTEPYNYLPRHTQPDYHHIIHHYYTVLPPAHTHTHTHTDTHTHTHTHLYLYLYLPLPELATWPPFRG